MKFIKTHKALTAILAILFILFILCFILFYKMFFSYGNDKYGRRLDNVYGLDISNYTITKIESELKELEHVENVKYNLNGKLINILFTINPELEKDKAKEYGDKVLEYFSDEEKENYDIQVFMIPKEKVEEAKYPMIGYRKANAEAFTWSNN